MNERDLGWLAGILEGEGCIGLYRRRQTRVYIAMVDRDVMERVQALWPCPTGLRLKYPPQNASHAHHKVQYEWTLRRHADIKAFLGLVLPLLGQRRQAQAQPVLDYIAVAPGKGGNNRDTRTHCIRGHEYSETNTRLDESGHRVCRDCVHARYLLRREAAKK